jgi:predicted unusual protein kinase regulating ubiquinone biosynthesis (AarF/ABC1/UbiB family)
VRADMQNLGMILRLMKRIAPGLDVKATAEEIRRRIGDELDYELEAQNQRRLARSSAATRSSSCPDVVTGPRARGARQPSSSRAPASTPSSSSTRPRATRVGEIVFRFFFGCMYRHHQFSGDPHPGNFLLHGRRAASRSSTSACSR